MLKIQQKTLCLANLCIVTIILKLASDFDELESEQHGQKQNIQRQILLWDSDSPNGGFLETKQSDDIRVMYVMLVEHRVAFRMGSCK